MNHEEAATQILDILIPSSEGLPGAGELGLAAEILAANPIFGPPLADVAGRADDHDAVVRAFEADHPGLLPGLIFAAYTRYYQHPRIWKAIGLPVRPPFPKGYELEPGDFRGLDAVRARGALYREP